MNFLKSIIRLVQHWSFKPISISLSPNTEKDDIWLAFKLLFQPWRWRSDRYEAGPRSPVIHRVEIEEEFEKYLGVKYAVSFNSGRSALMAILDSLNFDKGSEILLQAFTCNAAVNPIIWSGFKPVYVDCNEKTFNIDIEDLKRKITLRLGSGQAPKAVIVQHTFGLPADIDEILKICQENSLILIEDCAHSLGAEYGSINSSQAKNKKVGTFGKAAFFSFSRDKIISSVYGGMAVTDEDKLARKLKEYQEKIGYPSCFWIFQQLLHPVLMNWLILPTYSILGKYILVLFQKFHILSKAVHWKEKRGGKPGYFPKRMPEALAILALNQFKKLERFNRHRKEIALFYYDEIIKKCPKFIEGLPLNPEDRKNIFLRFAIKHPRAHEIIKKAWKQNFLIGDWYTTPIAPYDTQLDKLQYKLGSCPKAEKLSKETLNLPTHINILKKEAKLVTEFLKNNGD
ncbi:MAG: aminotransferase class I/II-fold pyridoxal phosphate-dependent enzyme [bacterium]|nr:aminotransferase class I/II-fold pyridoxal phosphate-dependent enzyme [bacterium]